MDKIITFPLKFTETYGEKIKEAADKVYLSKNKFILQAIQEKIDRQSK